MIPVEYFIVLSFAVFSIGIAGIAATRHFLLMILSAEVALVASTLLATVFYYFTSGGNIMLLLFAVWSVAAAEAMVLVVFYRYMAKYDANMDMTKLSKLRD